MINFGLGWILIFGVIMVVVSLVLLLGLIWLVWFVKSIDWYCV